MFTLHAFIVKFSCLCLISLKDLPLKESGYIQSSFSLCSVFLQAGSFSTDSWRFKVAPEKLRTKICHHLSVHVKVLSHKPRDPVWDLHVTRLGISLPYLSTIIKPGNINEKVRHHNLFMFFFHERTELASYWKGNRYENLAPREMLVQSSPACTVLLTDTGATGPHTGQTDVARPLLDEWLHRQMERLSCKLEKAVHIFPGNGSASNIIFVLAVAKTTKCWQICKCVTL